MRLVDAVFRQGHLSERALVDAIMTGDRPVHLDRCDICAERAVELNRWLDDARTLGHEAADAVFTPERLTSQHAQIMRKLEQLDQPSRVIAFPSYSRADVRDGGGRRVAPAWVGVAAAAGLAIGLVGGQVTARLGDDRTPAPGTMAVNTSAAETLVPIGDPSDLSRPDGRLMHLDLESLDVPALDVINESTPSILGARRGGD